MKDTHPFYCHKKKCRKTAWDTPEYLTKEDWAELKNIVSLIKNKEITKFYRLAAQGKIDFFFNKCIGWPEGKVYCAESLKYVEFVFNSPNMNDIEKLEKCLANSK